MATMAPMKPMNRRTAPVVKTMRATRAPSIEVMKFFIKRLNLPAFGASTSRNRRREEVTEERVASLCRSAQRGRHERAEGTPDHDSEGAHDQPRRAQVRHVRRDRGRPGGRAGILPGRGGLRDDRQV